MTNFKTCIMSLETIIIYIINTANVCGVNSKIPKSPNYLRSTSNPASKAYHNKILNVNDFILILTWPFKSGNKYIYS
jgi:hypothetical protein